MRAVSAILSGKKIFESNEKWMGKRNDGKIIQEDNSTNDSKFLIRNNYKILAWKVDLQGVHTGYSYQRQQFFLNIGKFHYWREV